MVSLKTIFKCYKVFFVLTSFFILGGTLQSFAAVDLICRFGYKKCCVDGTLTCVDEDDTNYKYCLITCGDDFIIGPIETCTSGAVQYKTSGTCGTSSRTCCSSGYWSGWDAACPKTCDGTKPTTYQTCTTSAGKSGTQTRTVTCDTSTGEWTTGSWETCTAPDCTSGETKTCPSNSKQVLTCTSAGKWSTSCTCPNGDGDGKVYCQGMPITTAQASTCYHGIWSRETCSGICCCSQDTPKLMSNGYPGCYGTRTTNKITTTGWQYSCQCAHSSGSGGGLMPNPDF